MVLPYHKSFRLPKTILEGLVKGKRINGKQVKKWDSITKLIKIYFASTIRATDEKVFYVKSAVLPLNACMFMNRPFLWIRQ